jgi:D-tagatose-1,6-bisphosphate aldolase subunit GatZ/KbaZ
MRALLELLARHKAGQGGGITSVCSAHPLVVEAALREAARARQPVLIEATSNQVNQFGGYTGMRPADFREWAGAIAARAGVRSHELLLGGDHLGPHAWRADSATVALAHAEDMVAGYVKAGFRKIHLDCSMGCNGDPQVLSDEEIASRAARLAREAERAWKAAGGEAPVYVIGTEVPTPGGAAEALLQLKPTEPAAVTTTLEAHRAAFRALGLEEALERVIALVVQPGVEFDNEKVVDYEPERAVALSRRIESEPNLVYEAHSTDYQREGMLARLVRDHFAILKVGPGVTFALREALWALAAIEQELGAAPALPLREVVLAAMRRDPRHFKAYYTNPESLTLDMQYSLSDRIRYYWTVPEVIAAVDALLVNLGRRGIPLPLLSQYLPVQFVRVREGQIKNEPRELLIESVAHVLRGYFVACRVSGANA